MNANRIAAASTEKSFRRGARMGLHGQILPRHTVMASAADSRGLFSESVPNSFAVWVAFTEIV